MGVNRAGFAICDDEVVREASTQEVIRRLFRYRCEYKMGLTEIDTVNRVLMLMEQLNCKETDRPVVCPAREAADTAKESGKGNDGIYCGAAIMLPDDKIVTGRNSPLLHASSAAVLNAIKELAKIPDDIALLDPMVVSSVSSMKSEILQNNQPSLNLEETLVALSVSATSNPTVKAAIKQLHKLAGCEMHISHIPTPGDESGLRKLGVNLTCDSNFSSKFLHAV
jgi:uncharacterized protein (UPF0371 family)